MSELQLVVLDMSGTTIKDKGEVSSSFIESLAEQNIRITADELVRVRGSSKREAVLNFIPDGPNRTERAHSVYKAFCYRLAEQYRTHPPEPVDGAESILKLLKRASIQVALNTGFDREIADLILNKLNWDNGIVDAVVCGNEVSRGRPAPDLILRAMELTGVIDVRRVAAVGDTVLDLQAGFQAGVRWNVGVCSGAHNRELLEQAPHTHLISTINDLTDLWKMPNGFA